MTATEIDVSESGDAALAAPEAARADVVAPPEDTIFTVLAGRARERSGIELRTTAIGGAVNAVLFFWQYPGLAWVATAFIAISAYGTWGLLDRREQREQAKEIPDPRSLRYLRWMRRGSLAIGSSAAILAVFKFMAAALGGPRW